MYDYRDILNKHYVIRLSAREISRQTGIDQVGVQEVHPCQLRGAKIWIFPFLPVLQMPGSLRKCMERFLAKAGVMRVTNILIMPRYSI